VGGFVDKVKRASADQGVSPYLKRPLRTLAHVLASRKSPEKTAARASRSTLRAEAQPSPPGSEGSPTVAD
jgi:hypothetical protein